MISGPASLGGASNPGTRVATDSDDVLVWRFNETSGTTFANTGSASGGDLTMGNGGNLGFPGGLHASTCFHSDASGLDTSALGAAGLSSTTSNITVSGWFMKKTTNAGLDWVVAKHDDSDGSTWVSPFYSIAFFVQASETDIGIALRQNDSTVVAPTSHPTGLGLEENRWHHVGFTHDEATLSLYLDGTLISQTAAVFSISYGDDGPWRFNGQPADSTQAVDGVLFQDWRVAQVVRPASWFEQVWNSK